MIKPLLAVSGFFLLFLALILVLLHAPSIAAADLAQGDEGVELRIEVPSQTLTVAERFTVTAVINTQHVLTDVRLLMQLPERVISASGVATTWLSLPLGSVRYTVTGVMQETLVEPASITASLRYSKTAILPAGALTVTYILVPSPGVLLETATPTPTEILTPTMELTPTAKPVAEPTKEAATEAPPKPTEEPTPTPTPTPAGGIGAVVGWLEENIIYVLILVGLLAIAAILLLLLILKRRKRGKKRRDTGTRPIAPRPTPTRPRKGVQAPCLLLNGKPDKRFILKPEGVTLGRAEDNDIVITGAVEGAETVSQHHARIYRQGAYWVVEDLRSSNGVYVNGQRTGRNLLRDGWSLRLGSVAFEFFAGVEGGAS
ncbi:MAG: FHA domain-containing protein [Anaerolineae bacterium]|nr:FHA domain-containing protein [Anaerolineae bacterium]